MFPLHDGTYDVVVIDAHAQPDGGTRLELALMNNPQKGTIVELLAQHLAGDPVEFLGIPGTLTVAGGAPSLALERS